MAGDTFQTFYGEFLVHPVPVELSLNYCSHACPMCFANLNSRVRHETTGAPLRYADTKATMNLLRDMWNRDSLEAFWLREGYPVLLSNRVDPFANSNWRVSLPLIEQLTQLDIPITFQTRGGKGIDEALDIVGPSVWYVTIDHSDDKTRQQVAPASPSIESRYELIAKLKERGHEVVVGLNPLSIEWVPEPERIFERCRELGVWGAWIDLLHFNKDQGAIAKREGKMPTEMIDRYLVRRNLAPDLFAHWMRTRRAAGEHGLEVYSTGQSTYSRYFEAFKRVYPKLLPTLQDWVNYCHDQGWGSDRPIGFEEFADFFAPLFPQQKLRIGHYIGATAHQIPREHPNWSNWMTFRELLLLSWGDRRVKWCPVRMPAFAYLPGDGWERKRKFERLQCDERGVPYMAFWPQYSEFMLEKV